MTSTAPLKADSEAVRSFSYVAAAPDGKRVKGTMSAPSERTVVRALAEEGYVPISVEEKSGSGLGSDVSLKRNKGFKMDATELAAFTRQFHQLLKAGLAVPKALSAMGEERDPKFTAMCEDLADRTSGGVTLSEAFGAYPTCFDGVFVSYISAAEASGELVATTKRLAHMLEKRSQLNLKIKAVTAYPKMVSYAIGLITVGIMLFLVPMFANIYAGFGAPLPKPTQVVVSFSNSLVPWTWHPLMDGMLGKLVGYPTGLRIIPWIVLSPSLWIAIFVFGLRTFLKRTRDNLEVGMKLDKLRFRVPIFGKLNARMSLFRWSSTMAGALSSGLQQREAIMLAARASGTRWHLLVAPGIIEGLQAGKPMSSMLTEHKGLFPADIRAMIRTGEEAGELSDMLESVSQAVDSEIDALVAGLGAKIEVALLMIMGIVVGGLLAVLYLPILNMATTAGEGMSGGDF